MRPRPEDTRLPGTDLPPTREARGQTARFSPGAVRWQVFGLRELCRLSPGSYCPPLPVPRRASAPVEVVLAYRCGAAPELHRVPFSLGRGPGTNTADNIRCTAAQCQARSARTRASKLCPRRAPGVMLSDSGARVRAFEGQYR